MGAWIETSVPWAQAMGVDVAPFMGAWIETNRRGRRRSSMPVAPFMGAWIETRLFLSASSLILSLPSWERGLKLGGYVHHQIVMDHVAPFMGAWIETGG